MRGFFRGVLPAVRLSRCGRSKVRSRQSLREIPGSTGPQAPRASADSGQKAHSCSLFRIRSGNSRRQRPRQIRLSGATSVVARDHHSCVAGPDRQSSPRWSAWFVAFQGAVQSDAGGTAASAGSFTGLQLMVLDGDNCFVGDAVVSRLIVPSLPLVLRSGTQLVASGLPREAVATIAGEEPGHRALQGRFRRRQRLSHAGEDAC
jgi:hypothetical protein